MHACLNLDLVERYAGGQCTAEERRVVDGHTARCDPCRQALETCRANEAFLSRLGNVVTAENTTPGGLPHDPVRGTDSPLPSADAIPGYKITAEVHRGGQAVVYEAVQRVTRRKVALKVLLEGPFAGPDSKRRFEREIALVASLRHPNIVPILDSGVSHGCFYYAMEYVRGETLADHVQAHRLSVEDTLALFAKVCEAVDAAHQKGVIHRDLKPSNILVDDRGEPRVLDFGLAKVDGPEVCADSESLLISVTGQVMGTLPYMSPEQAAGCPDQVDMRSDVYSLGVILYELLTGRYPYEVIGQAADVLMRIQEAEPRRPSTVQPHINDEVETIVLKALAKEKQRRYATAGMLGQDIQSFLAGEAIEAERDSALYVLKKKFRRYRVAMAAVTALAVLGIACFVGLSILYGRAKTQATLARQEWHLARTSELAARRNLYVARMNLAAQAWGRSDFRSMWELLLEEQPEPEAEDFRDFDWYYLWKLSRGDAVRTLRGQGGEVRAVACSPDGKHLATGSSDETVIVWDRHTGRRVATLTGYEACTFSLAFSPDGKRLATGGHYLTLWDLSTQRILATVDRGFVYPIQSVAFSPDGKTLATAHGWDTLPGEVRIWDAHTLAEKIRLSRFPQEAWCVAFSPDGRTLAAASWSSRTRSGEVRFWDAHTGKEVSVLAGDVPPARHVAFSPDGKVLALADPDKSVQLWDIETRELRRVLRGHGDRITTLAFAPSGGRLASGSVDATVRLWDLTTGRQQACLRGHTGPVYSVAFTPDGTGLVSGSRDRTVKIWDVPIDQNRNTLQGHSGSVRFVAFDPRGKLLATASEDATVKVWDAATGAERATLRGHTEGVQSVAFSPDGTLIATGSEDMTVRLWSPTTGRELSTLAAHTGDVETVAFAPDGRTLVTGCRDGTVSLWDVETKRLQATLPGPPGQLTAVALSPDGETLVTATEAAAVVRVWNLKTRKIRYDRRGHPGLVYCARFSPDGKTFATGGDRLIILWDVATGHVRARIPCSTWAYQLAFSPHGKILAVAGSTNVVTLLDLVTGRARAVLRDGPSSVRTVAFSPDGAMLAAGGRDGTVRLWRAAAIEEAWNHPDATQVLCKKARDLAGSGQLDDAERIMRATLATYDRTLGNDHVWTARSMLDLGSLLVRRNAPGQRAEAESLLTSATRVFERKLGARHPWNKDALTALRELYGPQGLDNPERLVNLVVTSYGPDLVSVIDAKSETQILQEAIRSARRRGRSPTNSLDALEHLLTSPQHWLVVGPFRATPDDGWQHPFPPEQAIDVRAEYEQVESPVRGWRPVTIPADEFVDLLRHCPRASGRTTHAVAYALTYLQGAKREEITLLIASSDGAKVWFNGEVVDDWIGYRAQRNSLYRIPVSLRAGPNKLLLKVVHAVEDWGFMVRAVDADGLPARVTWSTGQQASGHAEAPPGTQSSSGAEDSPWNR